MAGRAGVGAGVGVVVVSAVLLLLAGLPGVVAKMGWDALRDRRSQRS